MGVTVGCSRKGGREVGRGDADRFDAVNTAGKKGRRYCEVLEGKKYWSDLVEKVEGAQASN